MTEHKIINTEKYLIIVDDSEIKKGNWYWNELDKAIRKNNTINHSYHEKIIAHLPLNGSPILDGVDLLPPLENDFKTILFQGLGEVSMCWSQTPKGVFDSIKAIEIGNRILKSKEKYKYTEEDVIKTFKAGMDWVQHPKGTEPDLNRFIQSLQQPKLPVGFKCEMGTVSSYKDKMCNIRNEKTFIKKITNSQGQTEWIGEYIY